MPVDFRRVRDLLLSAPHNARFRRWFGRLMLLAGTGAFLASYMSLLGAVWTRPSLAHLDDSYGWLEKGAVTRECLSQKCLALQDLREQTQVPSPDYHVRELRWSGEQRAVAYYCPLHSVMLAALNAAGLSWENAFRVQWTLGYPFLGVGVAYFLTALWGPGVAGLALLLLSVHFLQFFIIITPSNLSLAIALYVWARIAATKGKATITALVGVFLMMAMHRIGSLYGLTTAAMLALLYERPFGRTQRRTLIAATGMSLLDLALPLIVKRPLLQSHSAPWPPGASGIFEEVHKWIDVLAEGMSSWGEPVGPFLLAGALAIVGVLSLDKERQRLVARIILPLFAFSLALVPVILPDFGPEAFMRYSSTLRVAFMGALALGLVRVGRELFGSLLPTREGSPPRLLDRFSLSARWFACAVAVMLMVAGTARAGSKHVARWMEMFFFLRDNDDYDLRVDQAKLLREKAHPGDRVLYMDQVSLTFFLTHGALEYGALLYTTLRGTPEEERWLAHPRLRFAVPMSPVEQLPLSRMGALGAAEVDRVELAAEPERLQRLRLWVKNPEGSTEIEVSTPGSADETPPRAPMRVPVPARSAGWIALAPPPGAGRIEVRLPNGARKLLVSGISLGADTMWPWNEPLRVRVHPRTGAPLSVDFSLEALLPKPLASRARVLDDHGSVVFVQLGN